MNNKKRFLIIVAAILVILIIGGAFATYFSIRHDVKEFISIAKDKYPGGLAEDALIAYLVDTNNSPQDRSRIAIWTLGQIQSDKALPILKGLYKDDPEGKTCKGRHSSVLCQYGIYKAIHATEMKWWPLHKKLNK
jgi:hypothetical protein